MKPTNRLRYVSRMVEDVLQTGSIVRYPDRILQQWWESYEGIRATGELIPGEWRDVPVEKE
jgi:hypothetical protein